MSDPYEYIQGNLRSEERLKELLDIQAEQLEHWFVLLKPEIYKLLREWVTEKNKTLKSYCESGQKFSLMDHVVRGTDLDNFLANLPTQPKLWDALVEKLGTGKGGSK